MGRVVDVDWEDLTKISDKFLEQSNILKKLSNDFEENFNTVDDCWSGFDSSNYNASSKKITKEIKVEATYLKVWYEFLTKSSKIYNENVDEGLQNINVLEQIINEDDV